ncbi:MAG: hypothetical protein JO030_04820 [Candidatus Eremiobacteraeota bacterium]|nr:hypothetical protein [Candidatus Eremiobacteraeota bacterium]
MRQFSRTAAPALVAALLITACGGGGSTGPGTPSAAQSTSTLLGGDPKPYNYSGQYSGLIMDSKNGTGKAAAELSQEKTDIGGALTIAGNPVVEYVSWIANAAVVSGTSVFVAASGYCSFAGKATYDTKTSVLAGSYHAVHGCTGETGTYKLKHHCYYKYGAAVDVRPDTGPKPC